MKQTILLMALCGLSCVSMSAQDDDMYFTPKKSSKAALDDNTPAYYVGSNRPVDEYNRRGHFRSRYQQIDGDSLSGDVISLTPGTGLYPDSTYVDANFADRAARQSAQGYADTDDYRYTRRMSRWDGFYDPWYAGWHSPYWYSYGYYDPWYWDYGAWYSPWYYGGWYDPWYYGGYWGGYYGGYWGWHHYYDPWYRPSWGGVAVVPGGTGRTIAGTRNHGSVTGRSSYSSGSTRFGSRGNYGTSTSQSAPARFGSRSTSTSTSRSYPSYSNNNSYSSQQSSFQGSRSYNTGTSSSGGSFGGTRSGGGGFSGGGHSGGGGGHFGGRR